MVWNGANDPQEFPDRDTDEPELTFFVASIYGARTRKGIVEVTLGDQKHQVTPSKAREMAGFLLEAAGAAEGDEILLRVLDRAGISQQRAAHVLMAMRQERTVLTRRAREEARRGVTEDQEQADLGD
jgi:hypothetical protein